MKAASSQSTKAKATKPAGADIRSFFGSAGSSKNSSQGSASKKAIEIVDDVPTLPLPTPQPTAPANPAPKRKKARLLESSDDEEEERKVSPPLKKVARLPSSSDDDETPSTKSRLKKGIKPAASPRKPTEKLKEVVEETDETPVRKTAKPIPGGSTTKKPVKGGDMGKDNDRETPVKKSTKSKETEKKVDKDNETPVKKPTKPRESVKKVDKDKDSETPVKKATKSKEVEKKADASAKKDTPKSAPKRKKASENDNFIDDESEEEAPRKKAKGKEKAVDPPDEESQTKPKFNWAAAKAAKLAGPSAHGSKAVPDGQPNCLAGLTFVFTGELSSFAREEAVDLAKRFGGRVTLQPSKVTNYVVLGDHAGPGKLKAIQKHGLKTLSEDEFLNMIATREGFIDDKTRAKMEKEEQKIKDAAREMEKAEKKAAKQAGSSKGPDPTSQLWTVRYAPTSLKEICGNKTLVEKLQTWLHDWSTSLKAGFTKPGKNGMNMYRAVLLSGPPGIGKTTSAHLCAKLEGFTPIELNASDARSKKLVESGTNINNRSLDGWMGGSGATNASGVEITDRSCLIMDEVDGMSAGDRGGVGALNALIKKTRIPIICIANDSGVPKLKPLQHTAFKLSFRKPDAGAVRSRILTIAFKEKMKIPANVVDQLVMGAQSDIRQVVNMLSTWKLTSNSMDFDESKALAKMNEKYSLMTPFNIINKMMGPYLFSSTARETLGEKMELYFHDHAFVPLFVQENYLKTEPARIRDLEGKEKVLEHLKLMDKAASSISDGDLVDALIHGPEQHWSLMPLHAVTSSVRPASCLFGTGGGYGGPNAMSFPLWLGQNSKQNKLQRQLTDVQIRMRLKVSADKPEIRQQYLPALLPHLVKPLIDVGASAVEEIIEKMDDYFLSKDEWDTLVELGVGDYKDELVLKKISSATKATLTRKYNASDHPVPFHKHELGKPVKKLGGGPAPDIEDAFDLDDDVEEPEPEVKSEDEDISKDKFIKEAKAKGKGKAPAKVSKQKK